MDAQEAISVIKEFMYESEVGTWEKFIDANKFIEFIKTEHELQEALLTLIKKDS